MSVTGREPRTMRASTGSRVVPGVGATMATSRPASALMRLDFAGVRRARDDDREPLADALAASVVGEVPGEGGGEARERRRVLDLGEVLVGEIDRGFGVREQAAKLLGPAAIERAQLALELAQGLAALGFGFGIDEIGDGFGLEEVHAAVEEGAAGELAGLGRAGAEGDEGFGDLLDDGVAAVEEKLRAILAGIGRGRGKPEDEGVVERFAAWAAEAAEACAARRREAAESGEDSSRRRA